MVLPQLEAKFSNLPQSLFINHPPSPMSSLFFSLLFNLSPVQSHSPSFRLSVSFDPLSLFRSLSLSSLFPSPPSPYTPLPPSAHWSVSWVCAVMPTAGLYH